MSPSRGIREIGIVTLLFCLLLLAFWAPRYLADGTAFFAILDDPSGVYLFHPNQVCNTELWKADGFPLWNPYNGCGAPHFANLQSSVLHATNGIFFFLPAATAIELLLLIRLLLCGLGTFILGRYLALSFPAALLLAIAFPLNSFELRFASLPNLNTDPLLPLTLAAFIWLGRSGRMVAALSASALTALQVFSGMPESAAFGMLLAITAYIYVALCGEGRQRGRGTLRKLAVLLGVLGAGVLLSAVQVAPFLEFLKHSWNTHTGPSPPGSHSIGAEALPAILYPFTTDSLPLYKYGLTLGTVLLVFLLCGLRRPWLRGLNYFLAAFGIFFLLKFFGVPPLRELGELPFFDLFAYTRYSIPPMLLGVLLIAARGFDEWRRDPSSLRPWMLLACALLAATAWYSIQTGCWQRGDGGYAIALIALTLLVVAIVLRSWRRTGTRGTGWLAGAILVLVPAELFLHFSRIPGNTRPWERQVQPLLRTPPPEFVQLLQDRMRPDDRIATLEEVCVVNGNQSMGPLRSMFIYDALYVRRYRIYISSLLLGEIDPLENRTLASLSSPLLDLAAVRYVVTKRRLAGIRDLLPGAPEAPGLRWAGGISPAVERLRDGQTERRLLLSEGSCRMEFDLHVPGDGARLEVCTGARDPDLHPVHTRLVVKHQEKQIALLDETTPHRDGNWRDISIALDSYAAKRITIELEVSAPTEPTLRCGIGDLRLIAGAPGRIGRFKPIFADGEYRIYFNPLARSRAYLATQAAVVEDPFDAALILSDPRSATADAVLLEEALDLPATTPPQPGAVGEVRFVSSTPRRVELDVSATQPGVLVLCDTHYPGWTATVDGEPSPIAAANIMFRGVAVPGGRHRVVFSYDPLSFKLGAGASILAALVWLALLLRCLRSTSPSQRTWSRERY